MSFKDSEESNFVGQNFQIESRAEAHVDIFDLDAEKQIVYDNDDMTIG